MRKARKRLWLVVGSIIAGILILAFALSNLEESIVFYYPPSKIPTDKQFQEIRIGGIVKEHSVTRIAVNKIEFTVTDNVSEIIVTYKGILPALFREGQGVVVQGLFNNRGIVVGNLLLTKHDENYKPPPN